MAANVGICDIVADKEVEKVWILVKVYWLSDECTTMVLSKEPCVVLDNENHEGVHAILSAQYQGNIGGKLA